jgi:hypothetical protein
MVTNAQLWFAISVPSIMALVGMLLNTRGLDKLEARLDRFEVRMDKYDGRLERIEDRLLTMLVDHEHRISHLEAKAK